MGKQSLADLRERPNIMQDLTVRQRLAKRALELKKAWLLAAFMTGYVPSRIETIIPNYSSLRRKDLEPYIVDLENDLRNALKIILVSPEDGMRPQAVAWLVEQCDRWQAEAQEGKLGILRLSNAHDFENAVGALHARSYMDIPPYAELLIQPGIDLAARHPEYMLVRDLECLHDLYRDTERLLATVRWSSQPEWAGAASENSQTLARTTILTCFNLLESFVSGLARTHVMLNPNLDAKTAAKLLSTEDSLRKRIVSVPRQILNREPPYDLNKPPFSTLFDRLKQYRDSFVHCEPGEQPSARGYVKEKLFHDVSPALVDEVVLTTESVIRQVWEAVYGVSGPRWLEPRDNGGQYRRHNLTVTPQTKKAD
jgi:hypothetical protein